MLITTLFSIIWTICRLPADLRADQGRSSQHDPRVRHLLLPDHGRLPIGQAAAISLYMFPFLALFAHPPPLRPQGGLDEHGRENRW